jgi:hypothetical protein
MKETLKIAAYGEPSSRKTLQIKHLIDGFGAENVGIISCEHGLNTIQSRLDERYVKRANSLDEFRQAYRWASETFTQPQQWIAVDGGSRLFDWVAQDIWQNVNRAYEEILNGTAPKALPDAIRKYAVYITSKDGVDTQRCWVAVSNHSKWLMDAMVKLPSSLYMTFWAERPNIDQYTKGVQWAPDLPGKGSRDAVIGAFDYILRLVSTGRESSKAVCRTSATSFAKCRDDWDVYQVPDEIEPFRLDELVRALRGMK